MRVKICGITQLHQGQKIAALGATALGFICVPQSKRYVTPQQLQEMTPQLPPSIDKIGVFANSTPQEITKLVTHSLLTGVQLHGDESPDFCQKLRQMLPEIEMIKALRVKTPTSLSLLDDYIPWVNTFLLDAYHPQLLGGTGKTLDWTILEQFNPPLPWFLAGGLTPDNIQSALEKVQPDGIDLSSGVEQAPGDKDLAKVSQLFQQL